MKPLLIVLVALLIPNAHAASGEGKGAPSPPPQAHHSKKNKQTVTQEFGENPALYQRFGIKGHAGRDIAQDCGTTVRSPSDGVVKLVGNNPDGYGHFIVLQDNLGYQHMLGHYQSISVKRGNYVKKDQTTGKTGSSGNSTGCHVHWGVRGSSVGNGYAGYIDPRSWISLREKREKRKTCVYDIPQAYSDVICEAHKKYPDSDPALIAAVLFWEHRGFEKNPETYDWGNLCSPMGACGAAQFMPLTWEAYGVDGDGDGKVERSSFRDSVHGATNLLGQYAGRHPDAAKVTEASIKYNCGPGCVGKQLKWETTQYKKAVVNLWWKFGSN